MTVVARGTRRPVPPVGSRCSVCNLRVTPTLSLQRRISENECRKHAASHVPFACGAIPAGSSGTPLRLLACDTASSRRAQQMLTIAPTVIADSRCCITSRDICVAINHLVGIGRGPQRPPCRSTRPATQLPPAPSARSAGASTSCSHPGSQNRQLGPYNTVCTASRKNSVGCMRSQALRSTDFAD